MADIGQQFASFGVNQGVGAGLRAVGARLPLPMPSFYNPNSENHFADSQVAQIIRGDGHARRNYILGGIGKVLGGTIGAAAGPLGAMGGGMVGSNLAGRFEHWLDHRGDTPTGTVGGEPATVDSSGGTASSGDTTIDPWTGATIRGGGATMPQFSQGTTGSTYGPTAGSYAGLPAAPDGGFVMPDFSSYGDMSQFDVPADETKHQARVSGDYSPHYQLNGVSNFMVGGFPVINGVNPDLNQRVVLRRRAGDN